MSKIHFHSYDAFRFFAFFKVYLFHATCTTLVVASDGSALQWIKEHLAYGGGIGVSFFFVLSGFLITYILSHEKINAGNISLGKFFLRRAFRIWPLFFLMVIMALVIPPDFAQTIGFHMNGGGYDTDWRYSLTFTENYKMLIEDGVPKTTPLSVFWSLCIEEHFYILWMFVFFLIPRKAIPYYLLTTIIVAPILRIFHDQIYATQHIVYQDLFTNMDYFAISGLLGYFVALNYRKVEEIILRIPLGVKIFYVLLVIVALNYQKLFFGYDVFLLNYFKTTIYAVMFTLLLLCFLPMKGPLKISENNILSKLGKISYGMYVYHIIWIHVVLKYCIHYNVAIDNLQSYCYYIFITFAGTVITSWISWKLFEKPLLNLREKLFPPS